MEALEELLAALPDEVVITAPEQMEKYRHDWSRNPPAGMPVAVVRAEDAEQVQEAVRWAARHRVPVVPRGAGSGLSGGSNAVDGCLMLVLERMRGIEIDTAARVAVVEPGALNAEVKAAAATHGLWYPPDPSSYEICSIGGNVATNAGGLCCVKYGVTTDYVLGLDVVLADGTLVTLGGPRVKDVAGLSLLKLFVGSEGTLGIVTRAILRLVPAQDARSTLVASFPTVAAAAEAVLAVGARMRPSMMELMDNASLNAVEDYRAMGLDRTAGALLVAQSDAPGPRERQDRGDASRLQAAGAAEVFATDDPEEEDVRRGPPPGLHRDRGARVALAGGRRRPGARAARAARGGGEDRGAVRRRDPCRRARGRRQHPPDHRVRPADPDSERRARAAFDDVMAAAIALGRHHHRRARCRARQKRAPCPTSGHDVMALTRRVKAALDPDGILNPGAVL
ncbi:MAG: FAD-binding protein [Nocardioides sp.]